MPRLSIFKTAAHSPGEVILSGDIYLQPIHSSRICIHAHGLNHTKAKKGMEVNLDHQQLQRQPADEFSVSVVDPRELERDVPSWENARNARAPEYTPEQLKHWQRSEREVGHFMQGTASHMHASMVRCERAQEAYDRCLTSLWTNAMGDNAYVQDQWNLLRMDPGFIEHVSYEPNSNVQVDEVDSSYYFGVDDNGTRQFQSDHVSWINQKVLESKMKYNKHGTKILDSQGNCVTFSICSCLGFVRCVRVCAHACIQIIWNVPCHTESCV